jgi:hypothetical protein
VGEEAKVWDETYNSALVRDHALVELNVEHVAKELAGGIDIRVDAVLSRENNSLHWVTPTAQRRETPFETPAHCGL